MAQLVVTVAVIDLACDWAVWNRTESGDVILAAAALCSLLLYAAVRAVRKNTRWLSTHA